MILEQDRKKQAKTAQEGKYFSFIASSKFEYCTKMKVPQNLESINVFNVVLILLLDSYVKLCWVWISPFVL